MNYNEISIFTTTPGAEILGGFLSRLGIDQFAVEDPGDLQLLIESGHNWDYIEEGLLDNEGEVCVKVYLPDTAQGVESLQALEQNLDELKSLDFGADMGSLRLEKGYVREEEWSESWKRYYKPFEVGERFVVRPCWEEYENKEGKVVLSLNPGMVFGTGMHASTKLCLTGLEQAVKDGDKVFDIGTGSGILAIGALLLGAKSALAVDIDYNAEAVVRENAALNGIGEDRLKVLTGNILEDEGLAGEIDGGFDVVVANIVADVIIRLAEKVPRFIKKGGRFICSGIILQRQEEVCRALVNAGFDMVEVKETDGWCSVSAEFK